MNVNYMVYLIRGDNDEKIDGNHELLDKLLINYRPDPTESSTGYFAKKIHIQSNNVIKIIDRHVSFTQSQFRNKTWLNIDQQLTLYCINSKNINSAIDHIKTLAEMKVQTQVIITHDSSPEDENYTINLGKLTELLESRYQPNRINKSLLHLDTNDWKGIDDINNFIIDSYNGFVNNNMSKTMESVTFRSFAPPKNHGVSKWIGYTSAIIGTLALGAAIATLLTTTIITATPLIVVTLAVTAFCCLATIIGTTLYQEYRHKFTNTDAKQTLADNTVAAIPQLPSTIHSTVHDPASPCNAYESENNSKI